MLWWALVGVSAGALELVELELDEVAAFAIAAPPPTTAPVTATVVTRRLIRWLNFVHLLYVGCANDPRRAS